MVVAVVAAGVVTTLLLPLSRRRLAGQRVFTQQAQVGQRGLPELRPQQVLLVRMVTRREVAQVVVGAAQRLLPQPLAGRVGLVVGVVAAVVAGGLGKTPAWAVAVG